MITIRNASLSDIPAILNVEQSWPEQGRAGADKFLSRMNKFSQGFYLACMGDASGEVVATITAMPLFYEPRDIGHFKNWDMVTHDGYIDDVDLAKSNALYIVSGVISSQYRGQNIFTPMVLREVELAHSLGLRYVLAGAVLPGYRKFHEQNSGCNAQEYAATRKGQHLLDPLLAMYEPIGFSVPDARHIIPEYFPDDASKNYGALVVRDLVQKPFVSLQPG